METAILVTGGAGYIGSHVCKALAGAGFRPVAYDSLINGHRWAVRWGPLEVGDLADRARLGAVIERYRPAAVVHLAAFIAAGESVVAPARYYDNNVGGMLSLLSAMREGGVARIVFSSTAAVYGTPQRLPIDETHPQAPLNPYGATKLIAERILADYAAAYGIRSVALRYFNAAGADPEGEIGEAHEPETHLIPLTLEAAAGLRPTVAVYGDGYATKDGTCVRDYVHVADLADAHVLALRSLDRAAGANAYNLGNGRGYSVREVIDTAERVAGRPISTVVHGPRAGDAAVLIADSRRARAELGWRPRRESLELQIADAWRWLLARRRRQRRRLDADLREPLPPSRLRRLLAVRAAAAERARRAAASAGAASGPAGGRRP